MRYVADLHIHSSYARGTSPQLTLENLASWAAIKGIDLLATGDFTHPAWLAELQSKLAQRPDGLFTLKAAPVDSGGQPPAVRFLLGTEVSCVYPQGGRTRRVHLLVYAPDFDAVARLCQALEPWGDLSFDGRPTLALSVRDLVEAVLGADARCLVVPAHAWTPWYSVYGSIGGFDSLAECFADMLPHLCAVESGLSSDPAMNWRVPELDKLAIVSFSDAHSLNRLGREVTVFEGELSYEGFTQAMREGHIAYTVEFHPQEGKYYFDGHRRCQVCQSPEETLRQGVRCPRCGRKFTLGVAHRLEKQAGRGAEESWAGGLVADPAGGRPLSNGWCRSRRYWLRCWADGPRVRGSRRFTTASCRRWGLSWLSWRRSRWNGLLSRQGSGWPRGWARCAAAWWRWSPATTGSTARFTSGRGRVGSLHSRGCCRRPWLGRVERPPNLGLTVVGGTLHGMVPSTLNVGGAPLPQVANQEAPPTHLLLLYHVVRLVA